MEAIGWFKKMGLGKVGVSCNVHEILAKLDRTEVERVLMTDNRLMCDLPGKEFLYVETSAETTHTLQDREVKLLMMLLWGHLDPERLELDGVEFVDPRKAGCDTQHWGPAAKKSKDKYVYEYQKAKAARPGAFNSIRERLNGLMSRIGGGAQEEKSSEDGAGS